MTYKAAPRPATFKHPKPKGRNCPERSGQPEQTYGAVLSHRESHGHKAMKPRLDCVLGSFKTGLDRCLLPNPSLRIPQQCNHNTGS